MEGRPPRDDDLFEWDDAPPRPRRDRERFDTGERRYDTDERRYDTGERSFDTSEGYDTGERRHDTGEQLPYDTERDPSETGERDPFDTGTGERDPFDTSERRRPSRRRRFGRRRRARSDTEERRRVQRDTSEYEREGRRSPPGRRKRHRDLPANVRRRQAFMGIGLVLLVIVGLVIAISGLSGGGGGSPASSVPLKRLVGQVIVGKSTHSPGKALLKRVRKGEVGGVIMLPQNSQTLGRDTKKLQKAAAAGGNPPLLLMIDQEGPPVKRVAGPPDVGEPQLGQKGDASGAKQVGQNTGKFLGGRGVNVDLAPLLDVKKPQTAKTIASRTYSSDPSVVSTVGVGFIEGLQAGGVGATAKHFPGLGNATQSTDDQAVTIAATKDSLENDLKPFQDAVNAGVDLVMVSTAKYPTLGAKKEAAFSPEIVNGLLRGDLGFDGVVITDDLEGGAASAEVTPGIAATEALTAGDDLLLYSRTDGASEKAYSTLLKGIKDGKFSRGAVEDAYTRVQKLKQQLAGG
jgi:beta-N-acetylhexosaminidase